MPGTILLGLVIALLIESGKSARALYRAIHFLPFMATLTAMAIAWEALLHPTIGLVNQTLAGLGIPTANWLRDHGVEPGRVDIDTHHLGMTEDEAIRQIAAVLDDHLTRESASRKAASGLAFSHDDRFTNKR